MFSQMFGHAGIKKGGGNSNVDKKKQQQQQNKTKTGRRNLMKSP